MKNGTKMLNLMYQRKKAGLTQVELAQRIGVSFQSLNYWISGKRNPSLKSIEHLSKELGMSTDEIINLFLKNEEEVKDNDVK